MHFTNPALLLLGLTPHDGPSTRSSNHLVRRDYSEFKAAVAESRAAAIEADKAFEKKFTDMELIACQPMYEDFFNRTAVCTAYMDDIVRPLSELMDKGFNMLEMSEPELWDFQNTVSQCIAFAAPGYDKAYVECMRSLEKCDEEKLDYLEESWKRSSEHSKKYCPSIIREYAKIWKEGYKFTPELKTFISMDAEGNTKTVTEHWRSVDKTITVPARTFYAKAWAFTTAFETDGPLAEATDVPPLARTTDAADGKDDNKADEKKDDDKSAAGVVQAGKGLVAVGALFAAGIAVIGFL